MPRAVGGTRAAHLEDVRLQDKAWLRLVCHVAAPGTRVAARGDAGRGQRSVVVSVAAVVLEAM
jgi:hypothetical protein